MGLIFSLNGRLKPHLSKYYRFMGGSMFLSCTKSVRVLFERRKSKKLKPQDVSYNGQIIPASTSVKFLGITFDSALTSYLQISLS